MKLDPFAKVKKNRSALPALVLGGTGLLALVLVAFFWLVGEMEKPQVVLDGEISHLGLSKQLSLKARDAKSGLSSIEVALMQEGKKAVLFEKTYPRGGYLSGAGPLK